MPRYRNPSSGAATRPSRIRFWHADGTGPSTRERILPTGRAQLIFDLDGASATLVGPSFVPQDIERTQRAG